MKLRPKPIVLFVVLGTIALFALQNNDTVEVEFLLWSWPMPQVVLIFVVLVLGILCGWGIREWRAHRAASRPETDGWET